ncbi:hypothetical protein NQZ68_014934 [Dissostichus eleginoides]|nr:hypothetical protein NQZ68_014934 [Dissostichus eleginoides]
MQRLRENEIYLRCSDRSSVFWDLYCAAPDRRETCEHSSEAKAFHDYTNGLINSVSRPLADNGSLNPPRSPRITE